MRFTSDWDEPCGACAIGPSGRETRARVRLDGVGHTESQSRKKPKNKQNCRAGLGSRAQRGAVLMSAESAAAVPEAARLLLHQLDRAVQRRAVGGIQLLYEKGLNDLARTHFSATRMPTADAVARVVGEENQTFLMLYKELSFRHQNYSKLPVSATDLVGSFKNYTLLFNVFLGLDPAAPQLEIPDVWTWDIVDDFVYHFGAYSTLQSRKDLSDEDRKTISADRAVWGATAVEKYLRELIKKGGLAGKSYPTAAADAKGSGAQSGGVSQRGSGVHSSLAALGEFAAIGLCAFQNLLGDYAGAIEALTPLDLSNKQKYQFSTVPAAATALSYNLAFAYLMVGRYVDSARVANEGLVSLNRNRHLLPRAQAQRAYVSQRQKHLFGILAAATSLLPQRFDEGLRKDLKEKYADAKRKMRKLGEAGEETKAGGAGLEAFREILTKVAPRNLGAGTPDQIPAFLSRLGRLGAAPGLYSYLRLCSTAEMSKLASFVGTTEKELARRLLQLKATTQGGRRWAGGSASNGATLASADIDFRIADQLVLVTEPKRQRRQTADFFLHNIIRYENLFESVVRDRGFQQSRK